MTQAQLPGTPQQDHDHGGSGGHRWMMIACCVPMLAVAVPLVATGVVGAGFLVVTVMCTVMMAMMMGWHGHGGGDRSGR